MQKPVAAAAKEPYEKPEVRKIRMVQGEMAVTGCKTASSHMGPTSGCFKSMCKNAGS